MRELSRMSRNTASKAVPSKPAFSDGGSRYRLGKGKRLPTFFTLKSEVFCGVAEPLAGFSLGGPVNFWAPPACSNNRNIRSVRKTKKSRAGIGAALWVAVLPQAPLVPLFRMAWTQVPAFCWISGKVFHTMGTPTGRLWGDRSPCWGQACSSSSSCWPRASSRSCWA